MPFHQPGAEILDSSKRVVADEGGGLAEASETEKGTQIKKQTWY